MMAPKSIAVGAMLQFRCKGVAIRIWEFIANEGVALFNRHRNICPGCILAPMIRSSKKEKSNA